MVNTRGNERGQGISKGSPLHKLPWLAAGAAIFISVIVGTMLLAVQIVDRNPPIRFISRTAVSSDVIQGGILEIQFTVDRYRFCKAEIDRWLVDSTGAKHSIPSYTTAVDTKLGLISDVRQITIPTATSVGNANYWIDARYYCNWLQRFIDWPIRVRSPILVFHVIPNPNLPEGLLWYPNQRNTMLGMYSYPQPGRHVVPMSQDLFRK